jgi:hypothetical protein
VACTTWDGAADRWGWDETGSGGSGWVREGVRGRGAARHGELTGGPGSRVLPCSVLNQFKPNKKYSKWFKQIQNSPNFDGSKRCFFVLQKLEIKYGWKKPEMRNNFA